MLEGRVKSRGRPVPLRWRLRKGAGFALPWAVTAALGAWRWSALGASSGDDGLIVAVASVFAMLVAVVGFCWSVGWIGPRRSSAPPARSDSAQG